MSIENSGTRPRFLDNTIQAYWSVALNHPTANSEDLTHNLNPRLKEYTSTIFTKGPRFGSGMFLASRFDKMYKDIFDGTCLGQAISLPLKTHIQSANVEQLAWQDSYLRGVPSTFWTPPDDTEQSPGYPYINPPFSPYNYCFDGSKSVRQGLVQAYALSYGWSEYYAYVPILFDRYHSAVQLLFRSMSAKPMEYLLWNMMTRLTYYDLCDRVVHVIASSWFRRNKFYVIHTPFREHQRNCQFWQGRRAAFTLIRQTDAHSLPLLKFKTMFQQRAEALYFEQLNGSVTDGKGKESCESRQSES